MKHVGRSILVIGLLVTLGAFSPLRAEVLEIHPYAGGLLIPNTVNFGSSAFELKQQGIYGVKGEFFTTPRLELGGNFAYLNHFEFKGSDPKNRGFLWELTGNYRFDLEKVKPFVSVGLGGLTVDTDQVRVAGASSSTPLFDDRDTFFTFSYGGGIKAPRLWGPIGLRADLRGRTLPNLLGRSSTWMELTGGFTVTF